MKKYLDIIKNNVLFKDIKDLEIEHILNCLCAKVNCYNKNENIILCGDFINVIGIVLSGSVKIIKEDLEGNINIITKLGINEIFAEAFVCAGVEESPVTVQANENCEILFLDYRNVISPCEKSCVFHMSLIKNMLSLVANKNVMLNQKIEIMSKRTTREKLLMFFNWQKHMAHSKKFTIRYNREALASYLCVDRSAMSRELCKLRDDGIIKFKKNDFEII